MSEQFPVWKDDTWKESDPGQRRLADPHRPDFRIRETLLSQRPRDNSGLIAIFTVLFILTVSLLVWRDSPGSYNQLAVIPGKVTGEHEYFRLVTAIAVHADLKHFISNAIFVALFSYLLYGYFGFWVFPAGAIALSALTNFFSLLTYPDHVRLVGASGLVYLMVGFWLTIYVLIERRLSLKKRLLRSVGVGLIVLIPSTFQENVSYRTHAIGFGVGVLSAAAYFHVRKQKIRQAEVFEIEN